MIASPPPLPGFVPTALFDPFELYVGPVYETGEPGAKTYAFRVDSRHLNKRGAIHGGMLMTLADLTLGQAVWDLTDRAPCVTLNMQSHFLRPAFDGAIIQVTPHLLRRTRALVFMRGDFTVAGEAVFAASSVWKLLGQD
jgi:uncharacterized protein (TIGR00369 family)